MKKYLLYFFVLLICAAIVRGLYTKITESRPIQKVLSDIGVLKPKKSYTRYLLDKGHLFIQDSALYTEKWNQLAQPSFWQEAMVLSPDSCLVNVAATRQILTKVQTNYYMGKSEKERLTFKDSIREVYQLEEEEEIYITTGKNHYYKFDKVMPNLVKGIKAFQKNEVDPWYAQAILLIESPNKLQQSPVGAYGSFQLMKSVAKRYGLTVNKLIDERENIKKSAHAASRLIKESCIPLTKGILNKANISYNESELWFKLIVLHVYHAGARNVGAVIKKIDPSEGGMSLIQKMWKTQYRGFKNASQNYSQLALASQIQLDKIIREKYDTSPPPKKQS